MLVAELDLELDAIQALQSEADASSTEQLVGSDERVVISASYSTWSKRASFQQAYKVVPPGGTRRRLSTDDNIYEFDEYGEPIVAGYVDSGDVPKMNYDLTLTVGPGRYHGSKDAISAYLKGTEGTSEIFELGQKNTFKVKGSVIKVPVTLWKTIGIPTGIGIISGGKDGLLFKRIDLDGAYIGEMKSYSKCRGSKRSGTWNCETSVSLTAPTGTPCTPECDASAQSK